MCLQKMKVVVIVILLLVCVWVLTRSRTSENYRPAVRAWRRPLGGYGIRGRGYGIRGRPYGYWRNYVQPYYYPLEPYEQYDRYDYTNEYNGDLCHARISIEDAFGPYAREMGAQAWKDWAGRQGFQKVYLSRDNSGSNDHAIVKYLGECKRERQRPPNAKEYASYNATPQSY